MIYIVYTYMIHIYKLSFTNSTNNSHTWYRGLTFLYLKFLIFVFLLFCFRGYVFSILQIIRETIFLHENLLCPVVTSKNLKQTRWSLLSTFLSLFFWRSKLLLGKYIQHNSTKDAMSDWIDNVVVWRSLVASWHNNKPNAFYPTSDFVPEITVR